MEEDYVGCLQTGQLADGLTKDSMRQQLADKLRHGRIKFLYVTLTMWLQRRNLWRKKKQELKSTTRSRNTKKKKKKKKKPQSELRIVKEEQDSSEDSGNA